MKFTIERNSLLRALGHAQSVVERRNTIPILSNVLIEAQAERVSLTATDMDIALVETVSSNVARQGALTMPAHTLYDIIRKLPEGAEVVVDGGDKGQVGLRAGRSKFTLACLPAEDFPKLAGGEMPATFRLEAGDLRGLVDRTRFAISTEETRYYLNGIYLHAAQSDGVKVLRAVATDGHRLARVEIPLPSGAETIPGVIIPRKTVSELRRLVDEAGGTLQVALSETRIRFAFEDVVLTSKLIDGTFPDYERVIPTTNDKVMEVNCKDFTAAVDRVATVSTEKSRAVKLTVSRGSLVVSATSPETGNASEEIEVRYDAPPIEIGFNSRYLLDITQQIDGDGARFIMADAGSPTLIRDVADASALYVLMPLRV
ncbi:MAG: DNA polymerase III subunit beta [Rhodospirillaceae bacterium]|nr:DNA polymerase III subunit beta [Rhodospirillaceae bacterium]